MTEKKELSTRKKITIQTLQKKKKNKEKVVFITAYDFPQAYFVDQANVDMILVGDSLAMTMLGHETTITATMEDMIRHSQAVKQGAKYAFIVGDMPYMSYQPSEEDAIRNAGRFIAEAGCDAVKLEGGRRVASRIKAIVDAGIVCMGHLGLTPQNLNQLGGYRVQGKTKDQFAQLLDDAIALEEAGASFILLEAIPNEVASLIASQLSIPVYGIGAGIDVDGQLVIIHDILGLFPRFTPRFVKRYAELGEQMQKAISSYAEEVRAQKFPGKEQFYPLAEESLQNIKQYFEKLQKKEKVDECTI